MTTKAMNYEVVVPSIPFENFKTHYVLLFNLNSMQDAAEICQYRGLLEEPLRLELNFTFPPEHVTEGIELKNQMSSVAVDSFTVA